MTPRQPQPVTFQERIDALKVDMGSIGSLADEAVMTELGIVASAVSDLADLVGVLADLTGSRTASEEATAKLPSHGGTMEFKVTAQRGVNNADPRGTTLLEGDNFSDIVLEAERQGYPRIIQAEQREVTPWRNVTGYDFEEETP